MAAPKINGYWETYGCDKCDNFDLYVITTNTGGTKADFATWFVPHTTNICVFKEEGGADFDKALSNGGYALPEYLIYPDRTFIKDPEVSDFEAAGIKVHQCGTHVDQFSLMPVSETKPLVWEINKNSFTMNVLKNDIYSIIFYAANGQAFTMISERSLTEGMNTITFGNKGMAHGVYFAEIKYGNDITRQKLLLK